MDTHYEDIMECGPLTAMCIYLRQEMFSSPPRIAVGQLLRWQKQVVNQIKMDFRSLSVPTPIVDLSPEDASLPIQGLIDQELPRRIYVVRDKTGRSGKTTLMRALSYQNPERILAIEDEVDHREIMKGVMRRRRLRWHGECLMLDLAKNRGHELDLEALIRDQPASSLWILTADKLKLPDRVRSNMWSFYEIDADVGVGHISMLNPVSLSESIKNNS